MKNDKFTLIRESFLVDTNERERVVYTGKLINSTDNTIKYVFKVEDGISRMTIIMNDDGCNIEQSFNDSLSKMEFILNKKGKYQLKMQNGYTLNFLTEASLIKIDDFEIKLKYNLYDEKLNLISLVDINIIGEDTIC